MIGLFFHLLILKSSKKQQHIVLIIAALEMISRHNISHLHCSVDS